MTVSASVELLGEKVILYGKDLKLTPCNNNPKLLFKLVREQARAIQYAYMELEELKTGGKGKKKITPTNSPKGKGLFDFPNA